jgi:hypothetical protein
MDSYVCTVDLLLCLLWSVAYCIKYYFLQFQVYEGAVYMHQGVNYLVEELDLASRTAFCRKADLKYYTKTRDYTDINVLGGEFVSSQDYYNSSFLYIFFIIDSSTGVVFSTSFCLLFFYSLHPKL